MKNIKRRKYYKFGFDRGRSIANCTSIPEIGERVDRAIDWVGLGDHIDDENRQEYFELICSKGESIDREYSPFEFLASEINKLKNADEKWSDFDAGIFDGIHHNYLERTK